MLPENGVSTHPGEFLAEDYLAPLQMTAAELACLLGVDAALFEEVVAERAPVDAGLAWRLSMVLNTSPEFWMNIQSAHDLTKNRPTEALARLPQIAADPPAPPAPVVPSTWPGPGREAAGTVSG